MSLINRSIHLATAIAVSTCALITLSGCNAPSSTGRVTLGEPIQLQDTAATTSGGRIVALGMLSSANATVCDASAPVAAAPFSLGAGDTLGLVLYSRYLASLDLPDQPTFAHAEAVSDE